MSDPAPAADRPEPGPAPYVPASTTLPETTIRAFLLSAVLAAGLGAANAYLGLFAGMTVSASIPAAVISMAVLKLLRGGNILENNAVQTAGSAGESLAAGVIFTFPALILLGTWSGFSYGTTTIIAAMGGILGVLFTIPLRRALIVEQPLRFPEGLATAEVLKVGERRGAGIMYLVFGGLAGAAFKLLSTGMKLVAESAGVARSIGGATFSVSINLSPALIAVGFIVGLHIAVVMFIGGALNWLVAIPLYSSIVGVPEGAQSAAEAAGRLWSTRTRYLGVGTMVVGGLWALVRLRTSLVRGISSGIEAYRRARQPGAAAVERTERDTPMQWVGIAAVLAVVPLFFVFHHVTGDVLTSAVMAVVMLVAGFLFSAVASYMAGLVGSSNNPISGVTISTILMAALLLRALLGADSAIGPAAAILVGAVVCCAAAIGGDNMQDLKTGRVVGATPYKQQIMQFVGVIAGALVMAPVLGLLHESYGIGSRQLSAPQATLMASVAGGVFKGGLPWNMVAIGAALGVVVILFDLWLERQKSGFRTPVLAFAVGIYLPFELSATIFIGGIVAWLVSRAREARKASADTRTLGERHGLLFAAGLITGEALTGILLAIPIAITTDKDVLAFFGTHELVLPGLGLLAAVLYAQYRVALGGRGR